ncbi:MAG: hypothetical protein EON54_16830 [Alcaligenaceae bacterium]|nr:MAG: hypothetical protein EON54_16830 [Alcaligenaceae bacterium]
MLVIFLHGATALLGVLGGHRYSKPLQRVIEAAAVSEAERRDLVLYTYLLDDRADEATLAGGAVACKTSNTARAGAEE